MIITCLARVVEQSKNMEDQAYDNYVALCKKRNVLENASIRVSITQKNTIDLFMRDIQRLMIEPRRSDYALFTDRVQMVERLYSDLEERRMRELREEHMKLVRDEKEGENLHKPYRRRIEIEMYALSLKKEKHRQFIADCQQRYEKTVTVIVVQPPPPSSSPPKLSTQITNAYQPYPPMKWCAFPLLDKKVWELIVFIQGPALSRICRAMYDLVQEHHALWEDLFANTDLFHHIRPKILPHDLEALSTRNFLTMVMMDVESSIARDKLHKYAIDGEHHSPFTLCHKGNNGVYCDSVCYGKQIFMLPRLSAAVLRHGSNVSQHAHYDSLRDRVIFLRDRLSNYVKNLFGLCKI